MNLEFVNDNNNHFSLGSVSFKVLDDVHTFDKYQENHDYNSDVIFQSRDLGMLRFEILKVADKVLRMDIKNKLIKFSEFVKFSNELTAKII